MDTLLKKLLSSIDNSWSGSVIIDSMPAKKTTFSNLAASNTSKNKIKFSKKSLVIGIVLVTVLLGTAVGFLFYNNYYLKNNSSSGGDELKNLVEKVGKLMELPNGETPTIATVSDVTKLAGQEFFKNAQNGDKVLIYANSKKAILYRPSINKIIDFSIVNLNSDGTGASTAENTPATGNVSSSASPSITPTPTKKAEKIKVVILNSTKEAGLAKKSANLLDEDKFDITTSNSSGEYDKTTVSITNKNNATNLDASAVAQSFTKIEAKVTTLPADEAAPAGADIVVILGTDFSEAY